MPSTDKLDYLEIGHIYIIFSCFYNIKNFIFLVMESYYHVIVMILYKPYFKRILALVTKSKRVAK